MSHIYRIVNSVNGKIYVGHTSEKNPQKRFYNHRYCLNLGTHANARLQNAWNKYGEGAFEFEIIEECAEEDKLIREQHYINVLNPAYNIAKVAGSRKGVPQPASAIEKMRLAALSRAHPKPEGFGEKMSAILKELYKDGNHPCIGRKYTTETIEKIRASNVAALPTRRFVGMTGKEHSGDAKAKMRAAKVGRKHSPETIEKRRAAMASFRASKSPEWFAECGRKISAAKAAKKLEKLQQLGRAAVWSA